MRPVLNRQGIRLFDQTWIERGVPGLVLMENAGRGAAHLIGLKLRPRAEGKPPRTGSQVAGSCIRCADEKALLGSKTLILCGPGNNGGDGFVVARHLAARSAQVDVVCTIAPSELQGDARLAFLALAALGIHVASLPAPEQLDEFFRDYDFVVDALLGTGANRPVEGMLRELILALNRSDAQVLSLDVPSGLDAETGGVLGVAVEAFHTVTFAHLKTGLLTTEGHRHAGTITVSHIGVPAELPTGLLPSAWLLEEADVSARFQERSPVAHKGKSGRVVVVAGTKGTVGAARLVSRGCLRAGAGLVTIASSEATVRSLESEVLEVMTHVLDARKESDDLLARADVLVVGSGLGQSGEALGFLKRVVAQARPIVVDADALRLLASHDEAVHFARPELVVLTPHAGEASGLLGCSAEEIESDRFAAVRRLVDRYGCNVLLKGSRSILMSPGAIPVVSAFGTQALATGGSGDVLAGLLGTFLIGASTQEQVFLALQTAVAAQGICAERWSSKHGSQGLLASEIADEVPNLLKDWASRAN